MVLRMTPRRALSVRSPLPTIVLLGPPAKKENKNLPAYRSTEHLAVKSCHTRRVTTRLLHMWNSPPSMLGPFCLRLVHTPSTSAKINGATMDASDSMINFGASTPSFPQVIFSLGVAPEYEP